MTTAVSRQAAFARLLFSAACIDLLVILLLIEVVRQFAGIWLAFPWLLFPLLATLFVYFALTELGFAGYSIGKLCVGVKIRPKAGPGNLGHVARLRQFGRRCLTLGLPNLNVFRVGYYYDNRDVFHTSTVVPHQPRSKPIGRTSPSAGGSGSVEGETRHTTSTGPTLSISGGARHGETVDIGTITNFASTGRLRIGRDLAWADLAFPDDRSVSGRHCVLACKEGQFFVIDGTDTKPSTASTHGTFVGNSRVGPASFTKVTGNSFRIADITISV